MFKSFVTLDFETVSAVDLEKCGADVYAEDPTTRVLCLWGKGASGNVKGWHPGEDPKWLHKLAADPNILKIAHGVGFEKAMWRRHMMPVYGFPDIPDEHWHCTMSMAAFKALPLALDRLASALHLTIPKDMEGNALIKKLNRLPNVTKKQPHPSYPVVTEEILERIDEYCQSDCASQDLVFRRLGLFPEQLRLVWLAYEKINERGVRIDQRFVARCMDLVEQTTVPLGAEFASLTGGLGIGQRDAFLKWLRRQDVQLENLQKETVEEALGLDDGNAEDSLGLIDPESPAYRPLYIRHLIGSSAVKKLPRMRDCACFDGRVRRTMQFHGAGPGRSTGRLIQTQNFPRGTLKVDPNADDQSIAIDAIFDAIMTGDREHVELTLGPAIEVVVSSLRYGIVPEPRYCFVAGDYSGIQARTVLAVSGQHDKAQLMASKDVDIYCDMAATIYKNPEITKANKKRFAAERQLGKNSVLGLGFGMGGKKFYTKYGKGHTLPFMRSVVKTYRKDWAPEVPRMWKGLEWASTETVWTGKPHIAYECEYAMSDGWLRCTLPSGRPIWYYNPQPVSRPMPLFDDEGNMLEDENGFVIYSDTDYRPGWSYWAQKTGVWKKQFAFGGLLTENVVMGIETDIKFDAILLAEANNFPIVMDIHDELVAEVLESTADEKAFKQIMEETKPWVKALQIPVHVGSWMGDRYRKAA